VAYHAVIVVVHNLPDSGASAHVQWFLDRHVEMRAYLDATGTRQSWRMFAPNPPRTNRFLKVLVEERDGNMTDLGHDTHGRQEYPYLFYDRLRKVNRRLMEIKRYQPHYAAWVCREWERSHGGARAAAVRLLEVWNRIPPPAEAPWGYEPLSLPLELVEEQRFACASLEHGQLPNELRARYGLQPAPDGVFRAAQIPTWWAVRHPVAGSGAAAEAGRPGTDVDSIQ
jgi:hypothetical protein